MSKWFPNLIIVIKLQFLNRLKNIKVPIYKVSSKKNNMNILYLGDKASLEYIASILYSDEPKKQLIGKTYLWNIKKKIKQIRDIDAIFVKTDRFFTKFLQKKGFIILPEWVEMQLEISQPLDKFFKHVKKSAKDDIRKINNFGFNYESVNNHTEFESFYHDIYLPFILNRHEKLTLPDATNYKEIKNTFEKGNLLLVKDKGEIISGCIIHSHGKTAYFSYAGVKTKSDYLTKGAGSALYYFFIYWAKKHDFTLLKFGGARPFLNDGLFQYKRKWNMTAKISDDMFGIFGFKLENKKIMDFILDNPFIFIEKNQLNGMIALKEKPSDEEIKENRKKYETPGLTDLKFISEKDFQNL